MGIYKPQRRLIMSNCNKYIIGGLGFLQDIILDEEGENGKKKCIWSKELKFAKSYTINQAKSIIDSLNKNGVEESCFIWSPFEQSYEKGLYEVYRKDTYYSIIDEKQSNVLEWRIRKYNTPKSDFNYLSSIFNNEKREVYSYDEAVEIARNRNILILEDILHILQNKYIL